MLRTDNLYRLASLLAVFGTAGETCWSQLVLGQAGSANAVRILYSDQAIFEAGETRKDLPCSVTNSNPVLGFDLRYHVRYEASVPLRDLAGSENLLTILFRVTPADGEATYLTQRVRVPSIDEDAKGEALLSGAFDLGEGKYKVDWLMRDRQERVCATSWEVEASLSSKDKDMELTLERNTVVSIDPEQFKEEPPVARSASTSPLHVKVMVNFAPQRPNSSSLQPIDTSALVSILRNISRDPRIGRFSLIAFNLHEQRVVFRQDCVDRIDFPALGEALETLELGTVDLKRLSDKNGDTNFLTALIQSEASVAGAAAPDALVFAGPKAMLEENVDANALKSLGALEYPVFYMNYNLNPHAVPWNDTIGKAVKMLRGSEYTISKPRDLWFAVTEMVAKIVKTKQVRRPDAPSTE